MKKTGAGGDPQNYNKATGRYASDGKNGDIIKGGEKMERVIELTKTNGYFWDKNPIVFGKNDKVILKFKSIYDISESVITLGNGAERVQKTLSQPFEIPEEVLFSGWLSVRIDMYLNGDKVKSWNLLPIKIIEADGEVHGEEEVKSFNKQLDGVEAIVADMESNKLNRSDFSAFVEKYEKAYKDIAEKHNKLAEIVGALKENNAL